MMRIIIRRNIMPLDNDLLLPSVIGAPTGEGPARARTTHCLGAMSLLVTLPAPLF